LSFCRMIPTLQFVSARLRNGLVEKDTETLN
jgi:hypothetical protein